MTRLCDACFENPAEVIQPDTRVFCRCCTVAEMRGDLDAILTHKKRMKEFDDGETT